MLSLSVVARYISDECPRMQDGVDKLFSFDPPIAEIARPHLADKLGELRTPLQATFAKDGSTVRVRRLRPVQITSA